MKVCSVPQDVHVPDFDEAFEDGRYSMAKDDELIGKFQAHRATDR